MASLDKSDDGKLPVVTPHEHAKDLAIGSEQDSVEQHKLRMSDLVRASHPVQLYVTDDSRSSRSQAS
jgi:hypothetical protein